MACSAVQQSNAEPVFQIADGVADRRGRNLAFLRSAPTLLIYGERGGYHEYEKPALANLKRAKASHIPNTGSHTHQDDPPATAKVVLAFLAEPV